MEKSKLGKENSNIFKKITGTKHRHVNSQNQQTSYSLMSHDFFKADNFATNVYKKNQLNKNSYSGIYPFNII